MKLDENVPLSVVDFLLAAGHDVSTVADEGLVGAVDVEVLRRRSPEALRGRRVRRRDDAYPVSA